MSRECVYPARTLVYRLELGAEDDPDAQWFDLGAEDSAAQWCEYHLHDTDTTVTLVVKCSGVTTIWDAWLEPVVSKRRIPQ